MEKLNDLRDLLTHEVTDLISAEDQIIEAMPLMIEKASNPELKKALKEHLRITEMQRKRLGQVNKLMDEAGEKDKKEGKGISGMLKSLFGSGTHKCKGMEGLISEGNKMMSADMNQEVLDAAIIACAQKIEHYEICGYGTARAFARELNLGNVAILLEETLNEEYKADNNLTKLAVGGGLNEEAEKADEDDEEEIEKAPNKKAEGSKSSGAKGFYGNGKAAPKKASSSTAKSNGTQKNTSPNRRQVTPKGTAESDGGSRGANTSSGSRNRTSGGTRNAPKASGNRSEGSGNKSAAGKRSAGAGKSTGRPKAASKGRSSGGNRGPSKGGGSRGHK